MAVAKGAAIPAARLLDAVEATQHAGRVFEQWAGMNAPELPPDPTDAMQVTLARWQNDRFGDVPATDCHMALGVIEELGEAFDEDATAEDAIDALGDVMVYSSQLCTANRLAVGPVIDLACLYLKAGHCHGSAVTIAGMLAHVALKHAQNIRGLGPVEAYRPRLVDALALMIAKALEDCTLAHELVVDPRGVFAVIGGEVSTRKPGDAMIPAKAVPALNAAIDSVLGVARAEAKLAEGVQMLAIAEAAGDDAHDITAGNMPTFLRLSSTARTDETPVFDERMGLWYESDAQFAERIAKHRADLSA